MATASKTKEPTLDDVSAQLETLKADIAALTQMLGEVGKGQARHATDDVRARADHLRSRVDGMPIRRAKARMPRWMRSGTSR